MPNAATDCNVLDRVGLTIDAETMDLQTSKTCLLQIYRQTLVSSNLDRVEHELSSAVTTLQCGCFVGALAAGPIADKIGRRPSLMVAALLAIIGTIMQASASGEIAAIFVGRFLAGLGVGGASMVTPLYSRCRTVLVLSW